MPTIRKVFGVITVIALAYAVGRMNIGSDGAALAATGIPPKDGAAPATRPAAPPVPVDPHAEALSRASTPGMHHEFLQPAVGKFEGTARFRTRDGGDWTELKGTIEREWVLQKHYVREVLKATAADGTPFEGLGFIAFDNVERQYQIAWMDSDSTDITVDTAMFEVMSKVMTMTGQHRDPSTSQVVRTRTTWDMSNPDRQVFNGFVIDEAGNEYKSYEAVFERVKK